MCIGADAAINALFTPVTSWWLGLPAVLGVPILFGVLRKELSLLMIYQALGSQDIGPLLDTVQIATFLVFLTFYVPCVSTFAVMLKTLGRREAVFSVLLSVPIAVFGAFAGLYLRRFDLDVFAQIVDADNPEKELPNGEVGEVVIRGPQVMMGYWKNPQATKEVLTEDGWLLTGDIAQVDEHGYTRIIARKADMWYPTRLKKKLAPSWPATLTY